MHPEPCIDDPLPTMTGGAAGVWLLGGLAVFGAVTLAAVANDKASRVPFSPRVYPYDNLKVELGRE